MKLEKIRISNQYGLRPTKTREALLGIFAEIQRPLSVPELQKLFVKKGIVVNKTTLYRELDNLVKNNILHTVQISPERISYEQSSRHHHHFVCQKCDRITDLSFCEEVLKKISLALKQEGKLLQKHSFEFFGICEFCH